jgi:hypothetical protein
MNARKIIDYYCNRMGVGRSINFDHHLFEEAFPCGYPTIYNNHIEAFLSSKIGSAWGCWRCEMIPETGDYIVSRHEGSDRRVYCDPDRRHLFVEDKDGYLIPIADRSSTYESEDKR